MSWNGTHWKSTATNFVKNSWEFNFEYYDVSVTNPAPNTDLHSNSVFKIDIPRTNLPSCFTKEGKCVFKFKYNDMQGAVPFLTNSEFENIVDAAPSDLTVNLNQQRPLSNFNAQSSSGWREYNPPTDLQTIVRAVPDTCRVCSLQMALINMNLTA